MLGMIIILSLLVYIFIHFYFELGSGGEYQFYRNVIRKSKKLDTKHLFPNDKIFGRIVIMNEYEYYGKILPYYVGNIVFEGRTQSNINYASWEGHKGFLVDFDPYQLEHKE